MHILVENLLYCISVKNYDNRLTVDKVIAIITRIRGNAPYSVMAARWAG